MLPSSNCCVSVVLLSVLCGCDTWPLILGVEHRQRVFENRVQREILGRKGRGVRRVVENTQRELLFYVFLTK